MSACLRLLTPGALVLMLTAAGVAADGPLSRIPNDAAIVVRLKSPQQTVEKVASLAEGIQEGLGQMLKARAEQVAANPRMQGADRTRDWFLIVFAQAGDEPQPVVAIPATDADALTSSIRAPWSGVIVGDWVVSAQHAELLEQFTQAPRSSIESVFDDQTRKIFDDGDLSALVNIDVLTEEYANEIDAVSEKVRQGIGQISQVPAEATGGLDMGAVADMYLSAFEKLLQGAEDSECLAVGVRVTEQGVSIDERLRVADGSETQRFLAGNETSDFDLLSSLPADKGLYFGFRGDMQTLTELNLSWTRAMLKDNPDTQKGLDKIVEAMRGIKYGGMMGAFELGSPENGLFQATMLVEASPTDKVRELMLMYGSQLGDMTIANLRQEMTVDENAETYGDRKADVVTVKQTFEGPQAAMQQMLMSMMFGPQGIQSRVVYLGDKYVQTTGGGREAMEAALKALEGGADNGLGDARAALLPSGNVILLADAASAIVKVLQVAASLPQIPIPLDPTALENVETSTSYIGFTMGAESDGLRCRTHVPLEQMKSLFQVGMVIQSMQNQ